MTSQTQNTLLDAVAAKARDAGVFGDVTVADGRLACKAAAADAEYRLETDQDGCLWVSLVTADRWLSESIETELLHTGDKMEELIDDELVELGFEDGPLKVEHFRSEDLLFTFRSRVPIEGLDAAAAAEVAAICLLAYQACFVQLGDMGGESDED